MNHKIRRPAFTTGIVLCLCLMFILAACAPASSLEQAAHTDFVTLQSSEVSPGSASSTGNIGQTFTSYYSGLQSIALYLKPGRPTSSELSKPGVLTLELKRTPQDATPIRQAQIDLGEIQQPGYYHFRFSPLPDSDRQDYYFELSLQEEGEVLVGNGPGDAYLQGALYQDQQAQDAQVAFRLTYDASDRLIGFVKEGVLWIFWTLAGFFLFVLPGWALFSLVWSKQGDFPSWAMLHWAEKLALAAGLGLAIYPLIVLWSGLFFQLGTSGLRWGAIFAWLVPLASLAFLIWKNLKNFKGWRASLTRYLKPFPWADLVLLIVIILILGTRFWVIRKLDVPMWGDAYHHTMIAQLIADNNGLFDSWQPFADLKSFSYHFGFHANTAIFHWLSGMEIPQATLWTGQLLNALAVIALYPLAMRLSRNRWAGTAAVLFGGLLFSMPMVFINWSRYTQLAGLAMMPAAVCAAWYVLDDSAHNPLSKERWRLIALAGFLLAGLALTHYRILAFVLVFFVAYLVLYISKTNYLSLLTSFIGIGAIATVLFLPWLIHLYAGKLVDLLVYQITTLPSQASEFTQQYNALGNLFDYLPALAWIALPLVIGWGLWRREKPVALVSLWWFLIFLSANPQWLHLPGAGALTNFAVLISAYLPASVLFGASIGWSVNAIYPYLTHPAKRNASPTLNNHRRTWLNWVIAGMAIIILVFMGFWGARQRLRDLNIPDHALVTRPDLRAASWIRNNLPPESHILVNEFFAYSGTSVVGSDGGWWLPLLARHTTTLPPLTYTAEKGPIPDYVQYVNELPAAIQAKGLNDPEVLQMLKDRKVSHVFIGQRQGRVNTSESLLNLDQLIDSPNYRPVYHQDRVWIFEVVQ